MVAMCVCFFFVFFYPSSSNWNCVAWLLKLWLWLLVFVKGDMLLVACDMWQVTCDMSYVKHDMWHLNNLFYLFSFFLLLVLVLLFPHIKRLAVSGSSGLKLATSRSNIWYGIIQKIYELDIGLKPSFNMTMTFTKCYC